MAFPSCMQFDCMVPSDSRCVKISDDDDDDDDAFTKFHLSGQQLAITSFSPLIKGITEMVRLLCWLSWWWWFILHICIWKPPIWFEKWHTGKIIDNWQTPLCLETTSLLIKHAPQRGSLGNCYPPTVPSKLSVTVSRGRRDVIFGNFLICGIKGGARIIAGGCNYSGAR